MHFYIFRPGEDIYGSYFFEIVATDRGGLSVSDKFEVVVQQHKQQRAFNHDFHLYLKIDKRNNFRTNVDWQLKVGVVDPVFVNNQTQ